MELSDLLEKDSIEYKSLQDKVLKQLKEVKSLTGSGGVFAPLLKDFLESVYILGNVDTLFQNNW